MRMKEWIAALFAGALLAGCSGFYAAAPEALQSGEASAAYQIYLPADYEEDNSRYYPALYLLPENGTADEGEETAEEILAAIASEEVMDMILVCPELPDPVLSPGVNAHDVIKSTVEAVDRNYRTISRPEGRAVCGFGAGGYLATILAYTDEEGALLSAPELFGLSGSISGDYAGEANPWLSQYEDFLSVSNQRRMSNSLLNAYYTFMAAASEDQKATAEGGAEDVISFFLAKGPAYNGMYYDYYGNADETVCSFTIENGEDDASFRSDALLKMLKGFTGRFFSTLINGELSLSPQAATEREPSFEAACRISLSEQIKDFQPEGTISVLPYVQVTDEAEETVLSEKSGQEAEMGFLKAEYEASPIALDNPGANAKVILYAKLLGASVRLSEEPFVRILSDSDIREGRFLDLMGAWHFEAADRVTSGKLPERSEWEDFEEVYPALGWWDSGFSQKKDMKAYAGYAWYVKEFELPADFPKEEYFLPMGSFDETDLVFVNGSLVGATGLNPETWEPEEDCWDTNRTYSVPPGLLNFGGSNTVTVLTHNASGDGGWYTGHPGLYTAAAFDAVKEDASECSTEETEGSFFRVTIDSAYRAAALSGEEGAGNGEETLPEDFLIYLPPGYFSPAEQNRIYPTAYFLHQFNSTSNSYRIDGIDRIVNEAIESGSLPPMILVVPDSNPDGFWMGDWEKMMTEEIVPYVDAHYRTIADARHRIIAGASMGGSGAYGIGLAHPELFSGIISYFGAINMGSVPLTKARKMTAEELSHFKQYFIAGDRDLYKFSLPAISLDHLLREAGISHFFELGEGGHDSAFYLPYVADSLRYMMK
ncbi:MAG: hypothetical protein K6G83_16570 [Lachnospiraceae bacterium]|nr:hypothetical protein [Lachnospiraceae bacterium]